MDNELQIRFLDHVAIRVLDLNKSVEWYENVLNLKKYQKPEWGEFPVMMIADKSGIAIFPANIKDEKMPENSKNVKIDHLAFNVDVDNFEKAKVKFTLLNIEYKFQDHHYFESIYINDPDGHVIELTTIKVSENKFYK